MGSQESGERAGRIWRKRNGGRRERMQGDETGHCCSFFAGLLPPSSEDARIPAVLDSGVSHCILAMDQCSCPDQTPLIFSKVFRLPLALVSWACHVATAVVWAVAWLSWLQWGRQRWCRRQRRWEHTPRGRAPCLPSPARRGTAPFSNGQTCFPGAHCPLSPASLEASCKFLSLLPPHWVQHGFAAGEGSNREVT